MSLAVLKSRALAGMDAPEVTVEVHLANGLPSFTKVGCQLDTSVTLFYEAAIVNYTRTR